jgi:hypothetical protein
VLRPDSITRRLRSRVKATNYAETEGDDESEDGRNESCEGPEAGNDAEDEFARAHRIAAEIWEHDSADPFGSCGERSCPSGALAFTCYQLVGVDTVWLIQSGLG